MSTGIMAHAAPSTKRISVPRHNLRFIAAWIAIPLMFRGWIMHSLLSGGGGTADVLRDGLFVTVACLPQDLLIACEALLAVIASRVVFAWLFGRRSGPACVVLATFLFFATHFYMFCDFLLHTKIGVRMDPVFFDFLATAATFTSSAEEVGRFGIVAGFAGLIFATCLAGRLFRTSLAGLRASRSLFIAMPILLLLAVVGHQLLPSQVSYAANNSIYLQQSRWLANLVGYGELSDPVEPNQALQWLTPECEQFQRLDPQYPLLKQTTGFHGPKQFDIAIAADERPHVVFLFMESFRAADIRVLGGKYPVSRNFDRLSQKGVLFQNFYANGVQTTRGVMASLFGLPPSFSTKSVQGNMPDLPLIGIADLFNRRGYASGYLTGCPLEFEAQREFFSHHGYGEVLGADAMSKQFPGASRTSWGYHDEHLMRFTVDWIKKNDQNDRPSFATVFTISHHHPWRVPDSYRPPAFDTGTNEEYSRFLETFHYSDHCLGEFVRLLRQEGLDKKTVLFVLADTGTPQGEHHDNFMLINYLYEENMRIPLLILAPDRLRAPAVVDCVGSQVDLLPTVMDMFGMTGPNHAVGTSLMRQVDQRKAFLNNPFALQYHGLRVGQKKYIFNVQAGESRMYDLSQDPDERHDRSEEASEEVARYGAMSRAVNQFLLQLYLQRGLTSP